MDTSADWAASTLFSPSKAREQQAQAQDWVSVDSWLSKKYPSRRVAQFERNEGTLQVLLTLASLNEDIDEEKSYIDRVERNALQALAKRAPQAQDDLSLLLSSSLDSQDALDALASVCVELECGDSDNAALASSIIDLTASHFDTAQLLEQITRQVDSLKAEQRRLDQMLTNLKHEKFKPDSDLPEKTSEWARNTKHLKAKVGEYDERLNSLRAGQAPGIRLEQVNAQMESLRTLQSRVSDCTAELQAYKSIPTNAKDARAQVEAARDHLRGLVNRRDYMFENLHENAT